MKPIRKGKAAAIAAGLIVAGVILFGAFSWRDFAARYYAGKVGSKDEREFQGAISYLKQLGPRGLPGLFRALRDERPEVCHLAAASIAEIRPLEASTITKLIGMLNDDKALTRFGAVFALQAIGPEAKGAIPKLIEAFSDPDPIVRGQAVLSMGFLDPESFSSFPDLVKKLKDESHQVRMSSALALRAFARKGKDIRTAIPFLVENLVDPNTIVRSASSSAINAAGQSAIAAIPTLKEMARGPDKSVASRALGLLGGIAPNENMDLFTEALKDSDLDVSEAAIKCLAPIAGKSVFDSLLEAFKSGSAEFRHNMLHSLDAGSPHAISIFIEALKDPDPECRILAADKLGGLGPTAKEAIPALEASADDPNDDVKNSVKVALEEVGRVAPR